MIHRPDYAQFPKDKRAVFLVSGGVDSTAMVLEAYKLGIKGIMMCNDVLTMPSARETLKKLTSYTGYELFMVEYEGSRSVSEILEQSFRMLPQVSKLAQKGRYDKNSFPCCHLLKRDAMNHALQSLGNPEKDVLILGLHSGEGSKHRRIRLSQLRREHTFLTRRSNGFFYYYPLRDCSTADVSAILAEYGFEGTQHSGCNLCPILLLYPGMARHNALRFLASVRYARKLGIDVDAVYQQELNLCGG